MGWEDDYTRQRVAGHELRKRWSTQFISILEIISPFGCVRPEQ